MNVDAEPCLVEFRQLCPSSASIQVTEAKCVEKSLAFEADGHLLEQAHGYVGIGAGHDIPESTNVSSAESKSQE